MAYAPIAFEISRTPHMLLGLWLSTVDQSALLRFEILAHRVFLHTHTHLISQ